MSLRWLIALTFAGLMAVAISIAVTLIGIEANELVRISAAQRLQFEADDVALDLDREVRTGRSSLVAYAEEPDLRGNDASGTLRRETLRLARRLFPRLLWVGIADDDGVLIVADPPSLQGERVAVPHPGDKPIRTFLAPPPKPLDSMPGASMVTYAIDLRDDDGRPAGMLAAQMDWMSFTEIHHEEIGRDRPPGALRTVVLSDSAAIEFTTSSRPPRPLDPETRAVLARAGLGSVVKLGGSELLVARTRIPLLEGVATPAMSIVLLEDMSLEFDPQRQMIRYVVAVGAICILLAALGGSMLAGWIAAPLDRLVAAARDHDGGATTTRLPHAAAYREIDTLSDALGELLRRIDDQGSRLASAFRTSFDAIVVSDEAGRVEAVNAAAESLFGRPAAEIVGREAAMLLPEPVEAESDDAGAKRLRVGQRGDGSTFPCHVTIGESRLPGGRRVITTFVHDLSSLQQLESELIRTQRHLRQVSRLVTVGQLGSQLSHEINQPLGAIANYVAATRTLLATDPPPARDRLDALMAKIQAQVARSSAILQRLRAHVAGSEPARRPANLNRLVERSLALTVDGPAFSKAQIRLDLASDLPACSVDAIQIQQVLVNLIQNAVEAMSDVQPAVVRVATWAEGGQVHVSVSDSGAGVAPEIRDRLFAPFNTSKQGGLGLGLSICHFIIEAHGGRITLRPNPSGGTIVEFTLPSEAASHEHRAA
ncbi:MAG: PAS domain S-box protein [Alphaproteobacteria bacterium]|nr:PAS domain S-box protein [Alphaproteobacteria bacterium]